MGLQRATAPVFGLLLAAAAHAQPVFPWRPVTLVLPSAPGDPTDLIARVLQPKMSERLGQPFVVENRPGGSALIVGANSGAKGSDLREFVAAAKGRGNVNFASPGAGTLSFLVGEEISRRSGLEAVHLAFKGGAPAVQAMLANQAQYGALPLNL